MAGFIGELISRNAPERNHYLIEEKGCLRKMHRLNMQEH